MGRFEYHINNDYWQHQYTKVLNANHCRTRGYRVHPVHTLPFGLEICHKQKGEADMFTKAPYLKKVSFLSR